MSLPIYLLRRCPSTISSCLYPPQNNERSVLLLEPLVEDQSASRDKVSLASQDAGHFKNGERFTYRQLLDLVLKADKAVTL
jgi:hypothetical protein